MRSLAPPREALPHVATPLRCLTSSRTWLQALIPDSTVSPKNVCGSAARQEVPCGEQRSPRLAPRTAVMAVPPAQLLQHIRRLADPSVPEPGSDATLLA